MSGSDESDVETLTHNDYKQIHNEIKQSKQNPETSSMFVSGWDDPDEDIEEVENPTANPITHILWAAENGEVDTLKELLSAKPGLVHARDDDGYTPLHRAAYSNHLAAVCYLLSANANVTIKTQMGWTPLHSACNWNNYAIVARLLAAGADPSAVSDGGMKLGFTWCECDIIETAKCQTPLHLVSAVSHSKATLLVLLLREDQTKVARKANNSGETPKDLARTRGIYSPLFKMVSPACSYIKSVEFTCNPYVRN